MTARTALGATVALLAFSGCIIHLGSGGWEGYRSSYNPRAALPQVEGDGVPARDERTVLEFDAVDLKGTFDVEVRVGAPQSVVLHGDENLLGYVRTEVHGGALELFMERGWEYEPDRRLWVEVTVPDLRAFSLSGTGRARIEGVDRESFALSLAGTGDIEASGRARELALVCNGTGDLDLSAFDAVDASVSIAGTGDVHLRASGSLDVHVSGSGDVRYDGNPEVRVSISGSGSVGRD